MLRRVGLLASFSVLVLTGGAHAAAPALPPPTRVDPAIYTTFSHLAQHATLPPWFDTRPVPERPAGMLPVLVRTRGAKADAMTVTMRTLASHGRPLHGGAPLASGALSLLVDQTGLASLVADPEVTKIALDLPGRRLRPLDKSRTETGTQTALRALLAKNGTLLDGTGITIADIDSGIYVHHPAFFRADAGAFAWVDLDGDGSFTAGKDGVDSDRDGTAEVTALLPGFGQSFYPPYQKLLETSSTLRPDLDFLYVDLNDDGERNFGKSFDESTPGYGEPLFVADDANGNGTLDVGERLLRLGSSKFRQIRTDKDRVRGEASRGIGAWLAPESYAEYTSHGTGVSGILSGGQWGVSKLLGLAPNAEILSYDYATKPSESQTEAVQWAIDGKPNVILTEYGEYTRQPLDGSSEEELLLDAAVKDGIVVVSPAGNLVTGGKHKSVSVGTTATVVGLDTDEYFEGSTLALITVLERGTSSQLTLRVTLPGGQVVDVPDQSTQPAAIDDDIVLAVERSTTTRGTTLRNIYLYSETPMPSGAYTLTASLPTAPAGGIPLELYVSDAVTSWGYGLTFDDATDAKTVCHPATADDTLAVAAYSLHDEDGYSNSSPAGKLATYSSSGPLLDGKPGIALAAPDNPLSTGIPELGKPGGEAASYAPFGGTSGAGPHVAAAAALLKQAFPNESPAQIKARLLDHAKPVDGPEVRWGHGKLDVNAALGIEVGNSDAPRDARIVLPEGGLVAERDSRIEVTVDDDGSTFRTRWDLDYDGTPDTAWIEGLATTLTPVEAGARAIRVYVADADGNVTGTTIETTVAEARVDDAPDGGAGDDVAAEDDTGGADCECTSASRSPDRIYGSAFLTLLVFIGALRPRFRRSHR